MGRKLSKKIQVVGLLATVLSLTLLINTQIIVATQEEEVFSWSGTLQWLSQNKQSFSKYLKTSAQVRLVLSAPETLKVYIQSSDDFQKSGLSGWLAVYSHWSTETAELDYIYTIPFTDTWYFTVWNPKLHDVYVSSFNGYIVPPPAQTPPPNETPAIPSIWLIIIAGIVGASVASGIITFYFLKIKKKSS